MRKLFLFMVIFFCVVMPVPSWSANNWTGVDGLIAVYDFENDLTDSSGNGQTLTSYSVIYDNSDPMVGSYDYDGDGTERYGYRSTGDLDADFPGKASTSFTILLWWEPSQVSSEVYIASMFDFSDSNERSWILAQGITGLYFTIMPVSGTDYTRHVQFVSSAEYVVNHEYHMAVTFNNDTRLISMEVWDNTDSEYILTANGEEVAETYAGADLQTSSAEFNIGRLENVGAGWSDGDIDEFVIFNRVLSRYEIARIREGTFSSTDTVHEWGTFEKRLESDESLTDAEKYGTVTLSAVFTGPSSQTYTIQGFWDGGENWKIRFTPDEVGSWSYVITSSDSDLNDVSNDGSFTAVAPTAAEIAANPNLRGRIKIHNNRKFTYDDDEPFIWLGGTMHSANSYKAPFAVSAGPGDTSDFKDGITDYASKGFNAMHLWVGLPNAGGTTTWHSMLDQNEHHDFGGWAFEGEDGSSPHGSQDWTQINPGYWQLLDKRIEYIWRSGMVPIIAIGAGYEFCNYYVTGTGEPDAWFAFSESQQPPTTSNPDEYKDYYRYIAARYGAYNAIFVPGWEYARSLSKHYVSCVTRDPQGHLVVQKDAYDYFSGQDDFDHLTSSLPVGTGNCSSVTSRLDFESESWYDFSMIQLWGGYSLATMKTKVEDDYDDTDGNGTMPVVVGETEYEGNDSSPTRATPTEARQRHWTFIFAGAAGASYGAYGIFDTNTDGYKGEPQDTFTEGLAFAGYDDMEWIGDFFGESQWLKLEPDDSKISQGYALLKDGVQYLGYDTSGGTFTVTMTAGNYISKWMNPTSGVWSSETAFTHSGGTKEFTAPYSEWALQVTRSPLAVPVIMIQTGM